MILYRYYIDVEISEEIIRGFSSPETVATEMGSVDLDRELLRERLWYADNERFADSKGVSNAVKAGRLVRVDPDENIQLIRRFRNPDLHETYPPYLTPNALGAFYSTGRIWRIGANVLGIDPRIRLSATSFVRSQQYQDRLVLAGKFAVKDSTHVSGNAFDIDLGGYSYHDPDLEREIVVSLREPAAQQTIASAFEHDLGVKPSDEPLRLGPEHFDARVPEALVYVLERIYETGRLNFLIEMAGTPNCVVHIAPSPKFMNN